MSSIVPYEGGQLDDTAELKEVERPIGMFGIVKGVVAIGIACLIGKIAGLF